ncbi:membrane protein FAM159A [Silurus asotus]|uniref:Membrane protein FAM159A n=1 Tax=Silurus asotus TaxID=30991 RepID=A0AAD5AAY7_SILAS|nr:membrane protein FAM159A [Silurus asotus]
MSALCSSYYTPEKELVSAFACPRDGGDERARFCCGFSDLKYCCDDSNGFFPYEYGYMWWLSIGALIGLSVAAVVLLAFLVTVCVLCILFINTKPSRLDSGLPLSLPGQSASNTGRETSPSPGCSTRPQGFFRKHFPSRKLHCAEQRAEPERLFQPCFRVTVARVNAEGPSYEPCSKPGACIG